MWNQRLGLPSVAVAETTPIDGIYAAVRANPGYSGLLMRVAESERALAGVYCESRHSKNAETSKPLLLNVMDCGFSLPNCITP